MGSESPGCSDLNRLHEDMQAEYSQIAGIVSAFDQRLLTVKSWGVTFSLATLALGFQQNHYGLFLIAAASGASFWIIEWSVKRHQVRYYPRMGDIEYETFTLFGVPTSAGRTSSAPMIDWSWYSAPARLFGASRPDTRTPAPPDPHRPEAWEDVNSRPGAYRWMLFWPALALPHVVVLALGLALFAIGLLGQLGPM